MVKIRIFERSNQKSNFSKTKIYFHKKNCCAIIRTYWATKYKSRSQNEFWATRPNISNLFLVGLRENTDTLRSLILCDDFLQIDFIRGMSSTQLNDGHLLYSLPSTEEMK